MQAKVTIGYIGGVDVLTAEMLVVVEALLAECLMTVLTLTSQGLTMFLSLVVYKAGMIYSSKTTTIRAAV